LKCAENSDPCAALDRIPIVRPLFFVLGVWHAAVSAIAGLYGAWLLVRSLLSWWGDDAVLGGLLLASGLIALPALGVIAQGSKGVRSAGAALALPFILLSLQALQWSFWMPHLWTYTLPFVPGAVLGSWAMTRQEKAV
jgi:hypothetical protein